MIGGLIELTRPMLRALPPEEAHDLTLRTLEMGLYPRPTSPDADVLTQNLWNLDFPNPIGIAAGFDKDARVPDAVLGLGCGFAEVGTVTPKPQTGNPTPRVFRLRNDAAIINRLGFNNGGHDAALLRLKKRGSKSGIVGVNIGANRDSEDRARDYAVGIERFFHVASYFTVNISSPNTPGLRDLQAPAALAELIAGVMGTRSRCADAMKEGPGSRRVPPIIVKLAPDIAEDDLAPILDVLGRHDVDGIAVSNTTLTRPGLVSKDAKQAGGLSGRPLFHRSTVLLARVYEITQGTIPLIGIGGIDSAERAVEKVQAGASLIQIYTGLVYAGPKLIGEVKAGLTRAAEEAGGLDELRGSRCGDWASQPLDGGS